MHLTKDHEVVICHDSNLDRLCDVDLDISSLNYDELPLMSEVIDVHFSDIYYTKRYDEPPGKFAKLRELFEIAQHYMISVDLKVDNEVLR